MLSDGSGNNDCKFKWTDGSDTSYRPPMRFDGIPVDTHVAGLAELFGSFKIRDHSASTKAVYICKKKAGGYLSSHFANITYDTVK
jgi:hypothetical protein